MALVGYAHRLEGAVLAGCVCLLGGGVFAVPRALCVCVCGVCRG